MKKNTEKKCRELMMEKCPKFVPYWKSYIKEEGPDEGITIQVIPFAEYTIDTLQLNDTDELKRIFSLVEFLLSEGSEPVKAAMATGYLECLMHKDPDQGKYKVFVQYLGKHAIEYCRAWDKFTRVKTEGLWDENVDIN